jgi:NADH dehydrogenase
MKTKKQNVVVVGGGFAGVKAALDLTKDTHIAVTLISDNDDFRYYPTLYHTATGGSRAASSVPLRDLLDPNRVQIIRGTVTELDRSLKLIKTADGKEIPYDHLVLALGVITNFFHIPGLEERAYGVKTPEDAAELKMHLHHQITDQRKPDLNYVIVGGGPTGVELAGVLGDYIKHICDKHGIKRRAIHVDLVESAPRLLARMPADVSRKVAKQLRKKGVRLYLKSAVQGQTADELMVNGKPIRSHTVIWTAGMANNPFFAQQGFQLNKNGKVRVDQYLQAEPCIFVIGDNADTPYSGMAQTAVHDGAYIAESLTRIIEHKQSPEPYFAKKPIYVIPAGPEWAAVLWGKVRLYGKLGWALRRAADFMAFKDYEPVFQATRLWLNEYQHEDLCSICQPDFDMTTAPSYVSRP